MKVVVTKITSQAHAGVENFHIDISMWHEALGPYVAGLMTERFGIPDPPSVPIARLPEPVRDFLASLLIEAAQVQR